METLLGNVAALSSDPKAWVVAALVALKALHSIWLYLRCPVMCGSVEITDQMIEEARAYRFQPRTSYLVIMLAGMGLAIGGLYMLNDATYGPLALVALVVGVFMFITEPARLFVHSAIMGVYATAGGDPEENALARDRLRSAHRERAVYETIVAGVVLAMLFFL